MAGLPYPGSRGLAPRTGTPSNVVDLMTLRLGSRGLPSRSLDIGGGVPATRRVSFLTEWPVTLLAAGVVGFLAWRYFKRGKRRRR